MKTRRDLLKCMLVGAVAGLGTLANSCENVRDRPPIVSQDTQDYEAIEKEGTEIIASIKNRSKYEVKIRRADKSRNGQSMIYGEAYDRISGEKKFSFILRQENPKSASLELLAEDSEGGLVVKASESDNGKSLLFAREKTKKGVTYTNQTGKPVEYFVITNSKTGKEVNADPQKINEYLEFLADFKRLYGN